MKTTINDWSFTGPFTINRDEQGKITGGQFNTTINATVEGVPDPISTGTTVDLTAEETEALVKKAEAANQEYIVKNYPN